MSRTINHHIAWRITTVASRNDMEWMDTFGFHYGRSMTTHYISLSVDEVEERMKQDGMEEYLIGGPHDGAELPKFVYYLYGCGFMYEDNHTRDVRVERIRAFLAEPVQERMRSMLAKDLQSTSHTCCPSQMAVLQYQSLAGAWTIFSPHFFPLVQIFDPSSSCCYLQAPSTVLDYKLAFDKRQETFDAIQTVNTLRFIRHEFPNDMMEELVVEDCGGSSRSTLRMLTRTHVISCRASNVIDCPDEFVQHLKQKGPGLVSHFKITRAFQNCASMFAGQQTTSTGEPCILQFDTNGKLCWCDVLPLGTPSEDAKDMVAQIQRVNGAGDNGNRSHWSPAATTRGANDTQTRRQKWKFTKEAGLGYHAMVLIGCRQEPKLGRTSETRHWYLLQNTWMSMPLLEVSAEFLALHMQGDGDCTCGISFVKERLRAMPPHLSVSESGGGGLVFESSIVGGNDVAYNGARKKGSKEIYCSEKGERGLFYKSSYVGDVVVCKSAPKTAPKETNCCVCS